MKKTMLILAALMALLVLTLTAPTQAQEPEDTLTVACTVNEDWCIVMTEAFEEETGIETSFVRRSSGETLAALIAGADDPEFSVWFGGPSDTYIAAIEEDILEPYISPNAADIPDDKKDADGYWTGIYIGALGFCSNAEILADLGLEPPTSWAELLDPALEDNILVAHPATSGTSFTAFWANVLRFATDMEAEEAGSGFHEDGEPTDAAVDMGFEFYKEMDSNVLQYTRSGSAPARLVGSGEAAVGIVFNHDCVQQIFQTFGENLVATFPSEGTGFEVGAVAVVKGGPEPVNARAWVDWVLTPEAQRIGPFDANNFQLPTNPNAEVHPLAVALEEVNLVDYDAVIAGGNRSAISTRFDEEIAVTPEE